MNDHGLPVITKPEDELADRIEANVLRRAWGRVCDFHVEVKDCGLVLKGRTRTYYAKQLVRQAATEAAGLPILADEVKVC